jgi:hypothetical protein
MSSAKVINAEARALDDALQSPNRDGFASMHRHDDLAAVGVTPFLVAAFLRDENKPVPAEHAGHVSRGAHWEAPAQGSESSISLAPFFTSTGVGSNQSARASFAFSMASASVSPALAQPGSSGKTAEKRLVSGSSSIRSRNFISPKVYLLRGGRARIGRITPRGPGQAGVKMPDSALQLS